MEGLSDKGQAAIMFAVVVLPSFVVWLTSPDPLLAEISLRMLAASIIGGVLVGLKELLGGKAPS